MKPVAVPSTATLGVPATGVGSSLPLRTIRSSPVRSAIRISPVGRNSIARGDVEPARDDRDFQIALFPGFELERTVGNFRRAPRRRTRPVGTIALGANAAGRIRDAVDIGGAVASSRVGAEIGAGELAALFFRRAEEGDDMRALLLVEHPGLKRHQAVLRQSGGDPILPERMQDIERRRPLVVAIVTSAAESVVDLFAGGRVGGCHDSRRRASRWGCRRWR